MPSPSASTRSYLNDLQKEQENQGSMTMGMFKELMEQSKADRERDRLKDAELAKERAETM